MHPNQFHLRRGFFRVFLWLGDAAGIYAALQLAYLTRFSAAFMAVFPVAEGVAPRALYDNFQWTAMGVWLAAFLYNGFYGRLSIKALDELLRVIRGVAMGWVIILAGTYLYRGVEFSRLVLGLSAGYVVVLVYSLREILKLAYGWAAARWLPPQRILVLGTGRMSKSIERVLHPQGELAIVKGTAKTAEELSRLLAADRVGEIYVGEPDLDHETLIAMAELAQEQGIPFRIVPDVLELRMGEVIIDESLGLPTFQVKPLALHGFTYLYKRVTDLAICAVLLALGIVPLMFVALLIRLDSPGPIFFRQKRIGLRGVIFELFKFRTMVADAESQRKALEAQNERQGPVFKIKNDPRLTRVGRWLRRFSIDELPQIINVLRGEMSIVGPRPPLAEEVEKYHRWAKKRLNVLPGLTGLWQVSGRARLSFDEMIELDIFYIEHWSPGLDLKILLRTIPAVFSSTGAY